MTESSSLVFLYSSIHRLDSGLRFDPILKYCYANSKICSGTIFADQLQRFILFSFPSGCGITDSGELLLFCVRDTSLYVKILRQASRQILTIFLPMKTKLLDYSFFCIRYSEHGRQGKCDELKRLKIGTHIETSLNHTTMFCRFGQRSKTRVSIFWWRHGM